MKTAFATLLLLTASQAGAADLPNPFRALGNEPGWSLTVQDGAYTFATQEGAQETGQIVPANDGLGFAAGTMTAGVEAKLCRDTMSGMPFPYSVTLQGAAGTHSGCGGDPASLLSGEWQIIEVAGDAVTLPATLAFADGTVAGSGGCNRFNGGFTLTGEGLGFGPIAATRMACAAPRMALEKTLFDTLPTISRFDLTDEGHLVLLSGDTRAVVARR